jgi:uncharacterized membrane protein YgcG
MVEIASLSLGHRVRTSLIPICVALTILAAFPSLLAVVAIGAPVGWSFGWYVAWFCVLVLTPAAAYAVGWFLTGGGRIRLPVLVAVVLMLFSYAGMIAVVVHLRGDDEQRCVDTTVMTVTAPAFCQNEPITGIRYVWYYGGTGTQIGDEVDGGSTTPPDAGSGSGSSGGGGDDGGIDGGGSEGGGEGGGGE